MSTIDLSLYFCTDREMMTQKGRCFEDVAEEAILGGVTCVQLREKTLSSRDFFEAGRRLKEITARHGVPLIVNDRADIALAVDAEGLHIGQKDIPCSVARRILGRGKIIGVSAATVEEAIAAEAGGADYLGVGAMHPTGTKEDTRTVTYEELVRICRAVSLPVVAIGGMDMATVPELKGSGVAGAAVVSAIAAASDPRQAAKDLKKVVSKVPDPYQIERNR